MSGAAAANLCHLACGQVDAYWCDHCAPIHLALLGYQRTRAAIYIHIYIYTCIHIYKHTHNIISINTHVRIYNAGSSTSSRGTSPPASASSKRRAAACRRPTASPTPSLTARCSRRTTRCEAFCGCCLCARLAPLPACSSCLVAFFRCLRRTAGGRFLRCPPAHNSPTQHTQHNTHIQQRHTTPPPTQLPHDARAL